MNQTPFGVSEAANVLWRELFELKKSQIKYITTIFNDFNKSVGELYKNKIHQREIMSEMLYEHTIVKASKYLTNDAYSFFCNILRKQLREYRRLDFIKKPI
jgi:hypothetical protein